MPSYSPQHHLRPPRRCFPDSNHKFLTLYYNCTGLEEDSLSLPLPLPNQLPCRCWRVPDHGAVNLFKLSDYYVSMTAGSACNQQITVPVTAAAALALDQSPSGSAVNVLRAALAGGFLIRWSSELLQWSEDTVRPRKLADTSTTLLPDCSNYTRSTSNCTYNSSLGTIVCNSSTEAGNRGCDPPSPTPVRQEAPPPPPPPPLMKEPSFKPTDDQEPLSSNPVIVEPPQGLDHKSSNQRMTILGWVFGALAFLAACVLTCWCGKDRCLPGHGTMNPSDEKGLLQQGSLAPKQYKYSEIKRITKSFRDKLGEGGCGSVYKGIASDGSSVAVKSLVETKGNYEDFSNEVVSISRTSHVNVVNLLGFCNERKKRALLYEFMPNKSLDKFLSRNGNANCHTLDIEKLYKIAIGVANGLQKTAILRLFISTSSLRTFFWM